MASLGDAILTGKAEGMNVLDESLIQHFREGRITEGLKRVVRDG